MHVAHPKYMVLQESMDELQSLCHAAQCLHANLLGQHMSTFSLGLKVVHPKRTGTNKRGSARTGNEA
jgi:hypothetical protein